MRQDDHFDAGLTQLGISQAQSHYDEYQKKFDGVELVVSSPLSRAIQTADLVLSPENGLLVEENDTTLHRFHPQRICVEDFRY